MRSFVLALLLLPVLAHADPEEEDQPIYHCQKQPATVEVTFKPEVDLKELTTWAVGFTCKNFTWEPRMVASGKKVTLVVPNKLTPAEAYRVFLGALSTMGLTVVPKGSLLEVVEESRAKRSTVPMLRDESGEQVVRTVYRVAHAQVDVVQKAMAIAKSDAGEIETAGSLLLVTDYASHVKDMLAIAKLVDVEGGSDGVYTIPLEHADAKQVEAVIEGVLAAGNAKDPAPTKIVVDERTNMLVVSGNEAAYHRAAALAARLDTDLGTGSGSTLRAYQLESAIAEELAKTLNEAITDQQTQAPRAGQAPLALEGKAHVIADPPTNKLIITSSARDFYALRDVIRELDQPRRQLYIEAMILEVQLGNQLDVGASSHGGMTVDDGSALLVGGIQAPNLKTTDVSGLATASGLIGGIIGAPLASSTTILGKSIPSYGLLFQALAQGGRTEILSTPSFTALDNVETKFKVGTNVPYQKGVNYGGLTGGTTPAGSAQVVVDRKDLVLELDVKPHISANDTVLLEIKHDAQDLADTSSTLGPTWTTRGIETRIVVQDQQTAVIGGLMQQREVSTESKVPLLGDLPLLGYLFKYKTVIKKKTNLLILLTPYIVKDQLDLELMRQRKIREYDEFTRSFRILDHAQLDPHIDYRRKRGLVEEINRSVQAVEADVAARAALTPPQRPEAGPVK